MRQHSIEAAVQRMCDTVVLASKPIIDAIFRAAAERPIWRIVCDVCKARMPDEPVKLAHAWASAYKAGWKHENEKDTCVACQEKR